MVNAPTLLNDKYQGRVYRPGPETRYSKSDKVRSSGNSIRSELEEKFEDARKARQPYELIWLRNHLFVLGEQYLSWNNFLRSFSTDMPDWRVRLVINQIRPAVNYHVAQLTKNRPIITAMPRTNEESDVNKGKLSDKFLDWIWDEMDMDMKMQEIALRMVIYGCAFLHVYWDKNAGDMMEVPGKYGMVDTIRIGDIRADVFSPHEWYPDPVATKHEDARWGFRGRVMHLDAIRDRYPDVADDIQEETVPFHALYHVRLRYLFGADYSNNRQSVIKNAVFFKEYFERPCPKYPDGRYIAFTDRNILSELTLKDICGPNNYDSLPQLMFEDFHVVDRYWPHASVNDWIAPQQEINRTRSQLIEIKNLNLQPKVLIEKGAGIPNTKWTSEAGEIIEVNSIGMVHILDAPQLPQGYFQVVQMLDADWKEVTEKYEVDTGEGSGGTRAASGIALLQEQGQIKMQPRGIRLERTMVKFAKQTLRLAKNFYIEERMIRVIGENNIVEVLSFTGEDFNTTDIKVQPASALPRLKTARQAYIFQLMQFGLLQGLDSKKILDLLELGDIASSNDINELNLSRARYENLMMTQGQQIPAQPQENHALHLQEHQRYMNSSDYYKLPPQLWAVHQAHLAQHQMMLMQQQMAMGNPPGEPQLQPGEQQPPQGPRGNLGEENEKKRPYLRQKSQGPYSSGEFGTESMQEIRQGL